MIRSEREFYDLVENYKAANAFYDANWEMAATDEASGVHALRAITGELLQFPCVTPEMLLRKVKFILSEKSLIEWLGQEDDLVHKLLTSFLSLKGGLV